LPVMSASGSISKSCTEKWGCDMLDETHKDAGLLYNFTGSGKGKTSAALGTTLRALGWGWRVAVLQFMKSARPTGERQFFRRYFPDVIFEEHGLGRSIYHGNHQLYAREGWLRAADLLQHFEGELLILDELNPALWHQYLSVAEVMDKLAARRPGLNVIVTGRHAPAELLAVSDLVSEIDNVKHPYLLGAAARKGLDY